eukprot:10538136-Alexandrium_andersonii.AAC.1
MWAWSFRQYTPCGHAAGSCNCVVVAGSATLQATVARTCGALGSTPRRRAEVAALRGRPGPWHV